MTSKPKKTKRYRYNLETVLKVRKIHELQQKEVLIKAEQKLLEEQTKEQKIIDEQSLHRGLLRKSYEGEIANFQHVMLRQYHLEKLKLDKEKQEHVRIDADKKRVEEQKKLLEAVKKKKVLEKDKEKKRVVWKRFNDREDMKFLDDIATSRFKPTDYDH